MSKQRIGMTDITTQALAVVDNDGVKALTLSNVADRLSVGPSALYTHVDGLDGLRNVVAVAATNNLTDAVRNAAIGVSGDNAVAAMGNAYRGFALGHPGQFASTLLPPIGNSADLAEASQSLLGVFALVYSGMGLTPEASALAARSTRSAIHGFLALEHLTGTTPAHDEEYQHLLETLERGLAR
ncbi:MAG: WHG domain-containing protein [Acidimicrobiales bacterium]